MKKKLSKGWRTAEIIFMVIGVLGVVNSDKSTLEGMIALYLGLFFLALATIIQIYAWSKKK